MLSKEQQHLLQLADMGTDIQVVIKYNDKNSITGLPYITTMNFKLTLADESAAQYPGGNELMSQYLKEHVINTSADRQSNETSGVSFYSR